jgi:urea transport system permease protein
MQRLIRVLAVLLICGTARLASGQAGAAPDHDFAAALQALPGASYGEKADVIKKLARSHPAGAREFLSALLDGRVETRASDGKVFIVREQGERYTLTDPLTGTPAGNAGTDDLEKVVINNGLRKLLRESIAQFDLASPDSAARAAAVAQMMRSLDDSTAQLLRQRLPIEPDASIRRAIVSALALADLDDGATQKRLAAIGTLASSLNPEVHNRLASLTDPATETNPEVRKAAARAVRRIEAWRTVYGGIETLFFGLSLGSVLVLAAIGLAITFGVMGVINMAHGELMMLGAYSTYVVQLLMPNHIGASLVVAVPVAFLVAGGVGVLIERTVVRFLYGRPLETLLATFGLSLILQQLVRDVFTANNRPVVPPDWMTGSWQINEALSITYNRLYIVLFMFVVFALLMLVLGRTRLGLEVRAVAQNRSMAKAMGVRTEWVDAMTFGLGSGIAGVAGVALSQLTNVGPNLGQSYIVDSFMVVVFGGVGNLWGTAISGMSLGIVNKVLEPYAGAVLGKILVLLFLILFIQRRPRGLFPQKGRAAEG